MRLRPLVFFRPVVLLLLLAISAAAQPAPSGDAVARYVKVPAAHVIVLQHVRVIDGTGAPAAADQNVTLVDGKIARMEPSTVAQPSNTAPPPDAATIQLDLTGRTVFPGIVGMHDHMYYIARPLDGEAHAEPPLLLPQMTFSSPHLYLGAGVTTLRTAGSVEPYTDLNVRKEIDAGRLPGPHMDVTGPYLEGAGSHFIQMHQLKDADEARATVDFWASQGVTSFKAYMGITRAELKAAIDESHKLGLKITGHLCSVTYPEAAEMGIDNLEHGFFVNTQLDPGKQPDVCPQHPADQTLMKMTADSPEAASLIALLVSHHVALTSTLPVFEPRSAGAAPMHGRALAALSPPAREAYLRSRDYVDKHPRDPASAFQPAVAYRNATALERKFVAAGGLLIAGPDPTGDGSVVPGYGDQREIELLVEAGFTPLEAIRIATLNGAIYMGRDRAIGSIAVVKNADLVVVKGDPTARIADIENTELVFKDGVGYDSQKLLDSAKGRYGQY